jgi:hypothetical protein
MNDQQPLDLVHTRTVILAGALIGVFLGAACGWQVAVESAQVVAGVVDYPPENPFFLYHQKTWTLLHQATAFALWLGLPDRTASVFLGGLVGALSFSGLSLGTFVLCRRPWISVALPMAALMSNACKENGGIYPVRLLSDNPWVLYGAMGASLTLVVWALLAARWRRCGAFLLGLAPAVHPLVGGWCLAVGLAALVWNWKHEAAGARRTIFWFLGGLACTAASLCLHLYLTRHFPHLAPEEAARYVQTFADHWDSHRKSFPLFDRTVVPAALFTMALCGTWLLGVGRPADGGTRFYLSALLLSSFFSLALCVATLWQGWLPARLVMLMPGRFINLVGLAFPGLLVGLAARHRDHFLFRALLAGLALYFMLRMFILEGIGVYVPGAGRMLWTVSMILLAMSGLLNPAPGVIGPTRRMIALSAWTGVVSLGLFVVVWFPKEWALSTLAAAAMVGAAALMTARRAGISLRGIERWGLGSGFPGATSALLESAAALAFALTAWWAVGPAALCTLALALCAVWLLHRTYGQPVNRWTILRGTFWHRFEHTLSDRLAAASWARAGGAAGLAAAGCLFLVLLGRQVAAGHVACDDWHSDPVWARVASGKGLLVTASTIRSVQVRTRRPVLLEGAALNQLPYVPASGPEMNRILREVYGEDLFRPRPDGWRRSGGLDPSSGRWLWQERGADEWRRLGNRFGFTQVLTYGNWELRLPIVARSAEYVLYEVPGAEEEWVRRNGLAR